MILSRVWYVLLGLAVAVALYVVYIAVGEYDRQATRFLKEGLASDSQTVEWALKIDARHRLDALLGGSVDATLQQALVLASASKDGKVPEKAKTDARKALGTIQEAIVADWRADALLAVDRDGRTIAQLGYDAIAGNDEFELGGYPAVNDALHGWLRDDVWVLGSKMYIVVARPVEYDVTQRPAGAVVGLKELHSKFTQELATRTRTNIAFYANGQRLAAGVGTVDFDREKLDAVGVDLKTLDETAYHEGRTETHLLNGDLGAVYARLPGDAWTLGGGFAVARTKTTPTGPIGFLSLADDKDKANVPWSILALVVLFAAVIGVGLTVLEHTLPLHELVSQGDRFKVGALEGLRVARFRGAYRVAAHSINEGVERAIEKAGGMTRKPADLESILGPAPAQPAMSAFSFPGADEISQVSGLSAQEAFLHGSAPLSPSQLSQPTAMKPAPPPAPTTAPAAWMPPPPGSAARPAVPPSGPRVPPRPAFGTTGATRVGPPPPPARPSSPDEDEATMVASVPAELMAQATPGALDDSAEWLTVYKEFIRLKRQCGEPTDGLTFDKFSQTLRKNRDALVHKHDCKSVKFSVYVKEGRASLKATPTKE
jgi:hypothetical protein